MKTASKRLITALTLAVLASLPLMATAGLHWSQR